MAATIGVSRECIYEWGRTIPEFSDALDRAKALEQLWWEDAGQTGMGADKFNGQVWGRSMAARFPDDWRETTKSENTHDVSKDLRDLLGMISGSSRSLPSDSE